MTKRLVCILGAGLSLLGLSESNRAPAQIFIPATSAFNSSGCSDSNLGGTELCVCDPITGCHCKGIPSQARANPEWKVIILPSDIGRPITDLPKFSPTILEGLGDVRPDNEGPNNQVPAEACDDQT